MFIIIIIIIRSIVYLLRIIFLCYAHVFDSLTKKINTSRTSLAHVFKVRVTFKVMSKSSAMPSLNVTASILAETLPQAKQ